MTRKKATLRERESDRRYDQRFIVRCPSELVAAVDEHARSHMTTASAFTRQALVAALQADGVELPLIPSNMKHRERETA